LSDQVSIALQAMSCIGLGYGTLQQVQALHDKPLATSAARLTDRLPRTADGKAVIVRCRAGLPLLFTPWSMWLGC